MVKMKVDCLHLPIMSCVAKFERVRGMAQNTYKIIFCFCISFHWAFERDHSVWPGRTPDIKAKNVLGIGSK